MSRGDELVIIGFPNLCIHPPLISGLDGFSTILIPATAESTGKTTIGAVVIVLVKLTSKAALLNTHGAGQGSCNGN
jgi:hypothetical protein